MALLTVMKDASILGGLNL